MKKLAPIGLLILLLYHTFGLSFAALFFEKDYLLASDAELASESVLMKMYLPGLPYPTDFQTNDPVEALVRQGDQFYNPTNISHEGDTLYVTLTSNQAARDRFFELAGAMERMSNPEQAAAKSPYGKVLKLMSSLLKNYLPQQEHYIFNSALADSKPARLQSHLNAPHYLPATMLMHTPPPEHC